MPALRSLLPGVFVRNPRDSLLADEGSAGLRFHGTPGRLSDKETVNAGRNSCGLGSNVFMPLLMIRSALCTTFSLLQEICTFSLKHSFLI